MKRQLTRNPLRWIICICVRVPVMVILNTLIWIGEVAEKIADEVNPHLPGLDR